MAADQRRKRLNSSGVVGCNSRELYRVRKKNLALLHSDANLSSHITLEWDGSKKRVISKREQIGISWRKLRPFFDSASDDNAILADIFDVPCDIFELQNLSGVLSLEVWQTYLSENERNSLRKFLPGGQEIETVMGALCSGDNFHFGNPFVEWEALLFSGALHPDAVLNHEQCLKADRKLYLRELQKYHNNMIGDLQKLKERCANCKDPEKEIIHQTWRSRNVRVSSLATGSRFDYLEDNATATSESCSWGAEEKACSSDNQTSTMMKGREFSERLHKVYTREKYRTSSNCLDHMVNVGARPEKGDKLQKRNIHCNDGSKYMSYFKISKKQHDLVKNMKQSGSVNQVLGDIQAFNVQPYELFVEEEQKNLHEHWLQLTKIHLPVAYGNWREIHLQRRRLIKALEQDLKERQTLLMAGVETESHDSMLQDQMNTTDHDSMLQEQMDTKSHDSMLQDQMDTEERDQLEAEGTCSESIDKSYSDSPSSRSLEKINGGRQIDGGNLDHESEDSDTTNLDDAHFEESGSSRKMSTIDCSANPTDTLLSVDVWPGVGISKSYYGSSSGHDYASGSNLSLANCHANEEPKTQVFDIAPNGHARGIAKNLLPRHPNNQTYMESDLRDRDIGKHLFTRQTNNGTFVESNLNGPGIGSELLRGQSDGGTFMESDLDVRNNGKNLLHRQTNDGTFGSYENRDKDELLHSLFKRPGVLSYERKERPINNLIDENRFSHHFQEQPDLSLPLEQARKKEEQVYLQHGVPENIYPEGNRYLIPTQQQLTSVGMQDWVVNSVRMPSHLHSHPVNGGSSLVPNWFSGEHQIHGGFAASDGGVVVPNQSIGNGSSAADQTLFSVLSHGNQLRSSFHSMPPNGQFISPRNYGMLREGSPMIGNVLPATSNPLNYLGGNEISSQGMNWVGMRHQNSNLNDPMEKPYLRSWNQ